MQGGGARLREQRQQGAQRRVASLAEAIRGQAARRGGASGSEDVPSEAGPAVAAGTAGGTMPRLVLRCPRERCPSLRRGHVLMNPRRALSRSVRVHVSLGLR